ncbi:hypothetical protein JKF63_06191 [Porcisia hertigi]|uniref:Uncharacterized protein n=1 Tax=Porcisia hertigi TaxID=2761500 RepID=A0A836LEE6_9TRYP|nr:hypothetical protein JKF63_06191 [Porcisia hertigi]
MPPKRKLPRRGRALDGELNLEAVSEERIDAVTAAPLDPVKFIELLSPDKTLRLFYNTSTLIRVAVDNGGFMQPPHFREPMSDELRKKIEVLEGKKFHFESSNTTIGSDDASGGGAIAIQHRHVYFDQIMDEFYLLSPVEVYVCPVCYEHYLKTRFLPIQMEQERPVKHLKSGRPVIDPLDLLSHMLGEAPGDCDAASDESSASHSAWDNVLIHLVFRRATQWKSHMEAHHGVNGVSAGDYRLRDVLCTYYNDYNQYNDEKHENEMRHYGDAKKKTTLTLQRYWHINASYNRLRYNRVVAATELAERHPEAVTVSAFPGEPIAHHFNPENEDEDDFIDDDTDADDYVPRFSPQSEDSNERESDFDESEEEPHQQSRKRNRERSVEVESGSPQLESSDTTQSSSCSDYDAQVQRQRALFKRGLLSERDCYLSRLSAEDRRFFERGQRINALSNHLYDPRMHLKSIQTSTLDDDTDWENIGEELPSKTLIKLKKEVSPAVPPLVADIVPAKTTLLLDEDVVSPTGVGHAPPLPCTRSSRLLLDEDE